MEEMERIARKYTKQLEAFVQICYAVIAAIYLYALISGIIWRAEGTLYMIVCIACGVILPLLTNGLLFDRWTQRVFNALAQSEQVRQDTFLQEWVNVKRGNSSSIAIAVAYTLETMGYCTFSAGPQHTFFVQKRQCVIL